VLGYETRRRVLLTVLILLLCAVAFVALSFALQRRLIYQPSGLPTPAAAERLPGARDVSFPTADGLRLAGWLVPAADVRHAPTVLVASGNAGDRSLRSSLASALRRSGMSVLLFDYRGYGGNAGSPTEAGLAADVRAARQFLVSEIGVPEERLVYFGESLGAAVVTELATEHPPAALVLRSPFTDLAAVGQAAFPFLPVRLLLLDRYPVRDLIARVRVPTVVVYGAADTIVPPEQSRAVAAAAGGPVELVEVAGAGHNDDVLLDGRQLVDAVVAVTKRTAGGC
jgi:fermentation-respiration switch protein FrsA (DUF1100 family)